MLFGVSAMRVKAENPDVSKMVRIPGSPAWFPRPAAPSARASREHNRRGSCRNAAQPCTPWLSSRVLGEGLDQHHVSVDGKLCSGMRSGAGGISHVVQTIEETDQVERSGVTIGAGHLERHIVEAESGAVARAASTDGA